MTTLPPPAAPVATPAKADNTTAPKVHPVSVSKIKTGDIMAFTNYVKVQSVGHDKYGRDELIVESLDNGAKSISIAGSELIEGGTSADQYQEEVLLSRTAVIRILLAQFHRPITVAWVKKDGSDRVLRGRLVDVEDANTGYSSAEDLDLPSTPTTPGGRPARLRQIDHRTLKYVIANGVKYTVK